MRGLHCRRSAVIGVAFLGVYLSTCSAQAQISVTTQHYDNARSGQNTQETVLTPSNVNSLSFGKLFSVPVDGHVHTQPLYLPGVLIGNQAHNVVYIATEHDGVYAINADNGAILWQRSFINPAAGITIVDQNDVDCQIPGVEIGITATPVIDSAAGTLFVLARTKENGQFKQRLHALDVKTGAERPNSPVEITASVPGTGDGSSGNPSVVPFNPLTENSRPGMLLQNGQVTMAWASVCDNGPYHGWVISYDATTLAQRAVYNTTPNGGLGGIWMSGSGLAGDSAGNTYFVTGNGSYDGVTEFSTSIVKLGPPSGGAFSVADWFTPYDQSSLSSADADLGSGGVLLLPDQPAGSPHQHLLLQGSKRGTMYLIDRDNMGHFNPNNNDQIVQHLPSALPGTWGLPTWWNNRIYVIGTNWSSSTYRPLRSYAFNPATGLLSTSPTMESASVFSFPGPSPVISSNGTANGIVWAIQVNQDDGSLPAVLRAYDANDLSTELYNSQQNPSRDFAGAAVKFTVPTVANGRVYVGTQTQLSVYGLLSPLASVSLNPGTVTGGASSTGTVTLSSPAPTGGLSVNLSSSNASVATVPGSVTVGQNATTADFAVNTTSVASTTSVTVTATYLGTPRMATLTVNPPAGPLAVTAVTLNPSSVTGGSTSNGTVTLSGAAPSGGATVQLTSSNTSAATVPVSVLVAQGVTNANFTVNTLAVAAVTPVTITATYNGSANGNLSVNPPSSFNPIRINVAGLAFTDSQGRIWSADSNFSGGNAASVSSAIANTVDDALYQTERWGPSTYTFTVPASSYNVTLKFVETYFTSGAASGQRLFNVAINGTTVLTNFDIKAAAGGANIAVDRTFAINAGAGSNNLQIQFIHVSGQPDDPKVDAIEIVSAGPTGPTITTQPASQTVIEGQTATFTVAVSGSTPLGYQWRKGGANIANATSSSYTTPATVVGDSGAKFDVVVSNAGGKVTSNQATLTVNALTVVTVSLNPASVSGGATSTGTVTLNGPAPAAGTVVQLLSSNTAAATVLGTVTVQPSTTSATFTANTSGVGAVTPVTITATFNGSANATLTVNPPPSVQSVTFSPSSVTGGANSTGTVTLSGPAPTGGSVVQLTSGNTSAATVPGTVTVAANSSTATFTVNTQAVAGATPVTITATYNGTANGNLTVNPPPSFTPIRVNVAGSAFTDSQARVWSADSNFTGGTVAVVSGRAIANTVDDALYQSERWGPSTYTFTVPAGSYQVTLKFAETYFTSGAASGQRLFNVAINGTTVLTNFDIKAAAGGANIAVDRTFAVTAGAGNNNLQIQFIHVSGQPDDPKVDAIEIVSSGG